MAKAKGIAFVHGRGKRKPQLQRDIETLASYISRKDKYTTYNQTFKGRILYSIAYNINKLHNKTKRKLSGVTLHQLKSA